MKLHTFARRRPVAALLAAVTALGLAGFVWTTQSSAASACPLPGNFEIDGDMAAGTCTPPGDDWNTPGLGVASTTQGGTYQTSGKDGGNPTGWTSSGSTPNKTDFARVYGFSRVVGGHYYTYIAWERTGSTGTQGYAIEIDNSAPRVGPNGVPQPDRSNGGVVVYISSQGSAAPAFDSACTFTSQSNYGTTCTTSNAAITAAINTTTMSDPLAGTSQLAGTFFEVAIDVTALTGITPSCPGSTAASGYIRSITGQTSNGNLKGYMAPLTLQPDSTCVPPAITTAATPGGALNPVGATQHDTVTVGTAQAPGVGSVAFFLCSPAEVTANGGDCSANGTQVGTAATLDGTGSASSANVGALTTPNDNAVGTYCWRAEFTPGANDHNYLPGTHTNSDTECFTVVHGTPTIATQIAITGNAPPGLGLTTLGDSATLTGFVGSVTGETLTFKLYGPFAAGQAPVCNVDHVVAAATTTGTLDANGHATTAQTYTPVAAGTYVWVASYPGDTLNDAYTGKCTDANESTTVVAAQIDVAKSANPVGPVSAGQTIGFDITVSNAGSVPALGVVVTDVLPAGANGVAGGDLNWSLSPAYTGCQITGALGSQVLSCSFNQVNGPASLPVIHVAAPTSQNDCGTVKNQASVTTTNGTGGDSDFATVTVQCAALSLTKTADHATVSAGQQIGFHVTASNTGAGVASGVSLSDPLPAGSGISWSIDTAGTTGPLTCQITGLVPHQTLACTGTLISGASETVHVVSATSDAGCQTYSNTASLTATNVSGTLQKTASTDVLCPGLTVTKTADHATVDAGTAIGFTVQVANTGAGTATAATLNDPLPPGSGVSWSISPAYAGPGTCQITGAVGSQTLACAFGDLAAGASTSVHITSATAFASCKAYVNTATAQATNQTTLPTSTATTTVLCPAVTISKSADASPVDAGSQIGFVVTVANSAAAGTGNATGVVVDDPLPAGTGVSWSITGAAGPCSILGLVPTQTLHCPVAVLGAGSTFSVHVISATQFESCKVYPNDAELQGSNFPTAHATASLTVQCPTLSIAKAADATVVSAGDQIGYTVTAHNGGPAIATGVTITDDLPGGSGIDWSISPAYTGPGSCAVTGAAPNQVLSCDLGSLGVDATATVHLVSATTFDSCATYENTAGLAASNAASLATTQVPIEVDCPNPSLTKTADAASVNAGDTIGFTITASNSAATGTGVARGVVIDDPLPFGPGIDWTIASGPENCAITTDATTQHQTLHCSAIDLSADDSETVHVTSGTSFVSCAAYTNVASLTLDNGPTIPTTPQPTVVANDEAAVFTASASVTVSCPALTVTKVADAAAVDSGNAVGFTITAANAGPGTAFAAVLQDALPAHPGVHWTVSPAYTGQGTCSLAGPDGAQVLTCALGDFLAKATASVHVTASTTADSCGELNNTVDLASGNAPTVSASATTTVNCAGTAPQTSSAPPPPSGGVLAETGPGPVSSEFGWGFALVLVGLLLTVLGRRRRITRAH